MIIDNRQVLFIFWENVVIQVPHMHCKIVQFYSKLWSMKLKWPERNSMLMKRVAEYNLTRVPMAIKTKLRILQTDIKQTVLQRQICSCSRYLCTCNFCSGPLLNIDCFSLEFINWTGSELPEKDALPHLQVGWSYWLWSFIKIIMYSGVIAKKLNLNINNGCRYHLTSQSQPCWSHSDPNS